MRHASRLLEHCGSTATSTILSLQTAKSWTLNAPPYMEAGKPRMTHTNGHKHHNTIVCDKAAALPSLFFEDIQRHIHQSHRCRTHIDRSHHYINHVFQPSSNPHSPLHPLAQHQSHFQPPSSPHHARSRNRRLSRSNVHRNHGHPSHHAKFRCSIRATRATSALTLFQLYIIHECVCRGGTAGRMAYLAGEIEL